MQPIRSRIYVLAFSTAASGSFKVRRAEAGNLYELDRIDGWQKGGGNLTGVIWRIVRHSFPSSPNRVPEGVPAR